MTLQTNLNVSPYFDDFDENKDYYKILFKPGVSVQVRELNQLQTILQNQIEKFGDNILKSGTIVSGVNFNFNPNYNYVRISDLDIDGVPTAPSTYVGMFIQSANTNLRARVIEAVDGYETTAPDTKTLYIEYVNSGDSGENSSFNSGEILTVSNANNSLFSVNVNNGGSGFTNNDTLIITGSLAVDPLSGDFTVGDEIVQGDTGSTAVITDILTGQFGSANTYQVLRITPRTQDLVNLSLNTTPWNFSNGSSITNGTAVANVAFTIGRNATGVVITDASGYVVSLPITNIGYGYTILPNIVIKPTVAGAGTDTFSATGINYLAKVKVPAGVVGSGTGYSMSVTEGYIFQKGYFLKVRPQSVIVNKYNEVNLANNVSVVFTTSEKIINSNIDTSLLDNIVSSTGGTSTNANAPGADRMELLPSLTVISTDDANGSDLYFSLVDFSEGKPFKQNRYTAYNEIANEMARRTNDEAGSYVTDEFIATTRSSLSGNAATFSVVVDPGKAYISGYRIETVDNYYEDANAGIDTATTNNAVVSMSFGNYIRISEMGGYFNFTHGDTILFDGTAVGFVSNNIFTIPTVTGSYLAKANIRSVVLESGVPGTSTAVYRVYLYNLVVSKGFNFKDAKSIYYVPSYDPTSNPAYWNASGVADIVLVQDPVTAANVASVYYANNSSLLFSAGTSTTLLNANNVTYTYRSSNNVSSISNTGVLTISYASSATDSFPYTGSLTSAQLDDLIFVPSTNLISYAALTGGSAAVVTNRNANTITATGGAFISEVAVGDYLYFEANNISANINPSSAVNSTSEFITVTNNPFSNNDAVLYLVATGNTAISGLSNNATYYVINSNTSGFKLTSSSGNTTAINITAGLSETGHQFSTSTAQNSTDIKKVVSIANNTYIQLNSNVKFTSSSTSAYRVFPQNVSMPFGSRVGLSAAVSANSKILTANVGFTLRGSTSSNVSSTYNILRTNIGPGTKNAVRNIPVKITTLNNPGGVKGPWCLGCPDIFRLKSVTVNQGGTSIDGTQYFYIDHNQNPDFLDLGFLYLDPKTSFTLSADAELIVLFDAFVNPNPTSPSYFVSQSYVGSNSAQQFINDSIDLVNLTTENGIINTNEVPELYSNRNGYFNLLNRIDFRPSALPTINVYSTDVNSSDTSTAYNVDDGVMTSLDVIPIRQTDPVSTVIFANNASIDLHFPLPDATFNADFTYYLPRVDNIVVSKTGLIDVIKGSPAVRPIPAAKPVDTILVDNIYVPDYPSIPKNPTSQLVNILDTKMVSERFTTTRLNGHLVTNLLSTSAKAALQPKGYTMSDIGNLERRIKDIEYYISLSQLEQAVQSKVIPSSVSTNVDRFKYGFFVDDFGSSKYADTSNPQYSATITLNTLYPLADNINLTHGNQNHYSLNVVSEKPVVVQSIASYSVTPTPCAIESGAPYALVEVARKQKDGTVADGSTDNYLAPKFTSNNATATLYFYTYSSPVNLKVIQSQTASSTSGSILKTSNDAVALTDADISFLKGFSFFQDSDVVLNTNSPNIATNYVTGCGKISIPHVAVAGRYYNIQTTKGPNDTKWRWILVYPIDTADYTDCYIDSNPTVPVVLTTTPVPITTTPATPFTTTPVPITTTPVPTTTAPVTTAPVTTTPYASTYLYLKSAGMSISGSGLISALTFGGFDPLNPPPGTAYSSVDITSWTAIKNSELAVNYPIDTTEDANGKFRSVYIPSQTVANAIRYDLYNRTGVNYKILSDGTGAALVDAIHGFYTTYVQRVPELVGLYYWITQIVVKGQTLARQQSEIAAIASSYASQWGPVFDYRWNTSSGVDISNYSIPSAPTPTTQNWAFIRGSSTGKNDTLESTTSGAVGDSFQQYFYDPSLVTLTPYTEVFGVTTDTLLRGLSKRMQNLGFNNYTLSTNDLPALTTIYNWYWNNPTSTSNIDGFGRAPDIEGYTYWVADYISRNGDLNTIRSNFFADSQPEVQYYKTYGTSYTLRAQGKISQTGATNIVYGTNAPAVSGGSRSAGSGSGITTVTVPSTTSTSTGSVSVNTTSSVTVSATNTRGFVQTTATSVAPQITYSPITDYEGGILYWIGSDGERYFRSADDNNYSFYKIPDGPG